MKNVKTSPKDVFLQLLMMVMLYICVISLISISFAYIDYWHPDQLNYYNGPLDTIKHSSSMLIVAFPILLLLGWLIQKEYRKESEKHELKFRKWLVYLTLFVSAITIVIDLIQLVYKFYNGDLTLPFALKVVSVLLLAGAVFGYYIWDVQSQPQKSKIPAKVAYGSSVLVVGMIVLGFVIVGTPATQRQIRMDEQRVNDLQMLQGEIISYWQMKEVLPAKTDELKNDLKGFIPPVDPVSKQPYEYKIIEPLKFSLCAVFDRPNQKEFSGATEARPASYYGGFYPYTETWIHDAGQKCFDRTIDPSLYPKQNK